MFSRSNRSVVHPWHLLICLMAGCIPAAAFAQHWNPTADFTITHGNPNGVWSYGWMPGDFSVINLHPIHTTPPEVPLWGSYLTGDPSPCIWVNTTSGVSYGILPNQLSLHPSYRGDPSIVRWTNPLGAMRGTLLIDGHFSPGDSGSMQVAVRIDGVEIWHGQDSGTFSIGRSAATTQVIDFAVYGAYYSGNTGLDADIVFIPTCLADFNDDGGVDGADVAAFFGAWENGEAAGDFNEDGGVDGDDVGAFFDRWSAGC